MRGSRHWAAGALRLVVTLCVAVAGNAHAAPARLTASTADVRGLYSPSTGTVYAATAGGGLWRSSDNGANWARVATFPARYVAAVAGSATNPSIIFAATRDGVLRTIDAGASWTQLTYESATAVAVDPSNDQVVVIGVPGAGIYRSADRGQSFALSNSGLDNTDVRVLVPGTAAGTFFVALYSNATGGWGGVFRSTDAGATWASWNGSGAGGLPSRFVTSVAVTASGAVIAGTYDAATGGRAYRRVGAGSWVSAIASNTSGVIALHADRNAPSTVWLGTRVQGVWKSANDGASFVASSNAAQDVFNDVQALGTIPGTANRVLAAAVGLGVYVSTDGGANWPKSSAGLAADRAVALEPGASASELFMGTDGGGMYRSTNGGTSFVAANAGLVNAVYGPKTLDVISVASAGSVVYAATFGFGGLYQWNGASAWARVGEAGLPNDAAGFSNPMAVAVDPSNPQIAFYALFDGGNAGTWRRNGGPVWTLSRQGPIGGAGAGRVIAGAPGSGRWYLLGHDAAADRSTDNGVSWSRVGVVLPPGPGFMPITFFSLAENPAVPSTALASTSKGLLRSYDQGATWSPVNPSGLQSTALTGVVFSAAVSGRVFAGDRAGHFYCSNDAGASWIVRENLAASIVNVRWLNNLVFVSTDGAGVMQRDPTCP